MTDQLVSTENETTPKAAPEGGRPSTMRKRAKTKKAPGKSKGETLIAMLSSARGASIAVLSKRLGWQPHTIRAAISRLRKAGHTIERRASKAGPVYQILNADSA